MKLPEPQHMLGLRAMGKKGLDAYFFTMSGFLIWGSCGRSTSYSNYLQKRFWRIYPELWMAIAIEMAVLFFFYAGEYNWPQTMLFVVTQSTFFQFWTPDCLRGYGCGTPNGALWTIGVLIQFYVIAYWLYRWLHAKKLIVWIMGGVIPAIIIGLVSPLIRNTMPEVIGKLYGQTFLPYLWMFVIPCFVAEYKDKILPVLVRYWWVFLLAVLIRKYAISTDIKMAYGLFHTLLLFFSLIGMAYVFPQLNVKTDISYGIYIYHMTVVNALIATGYLHDQWLLLFVLFVTCLLAWASTVTIGRWSLKMKYK